MGRVTGRRRMVMVGWSEMEIGALSMPRRQCRVSRAGGYQSVGGIGDSPRAGERARGSRSAGGGRDRAQR